VVYREMLERAEVIIVAAGMEGALPSVVGGLFARPGDFAVPTSVGYGASFGGVAALLSMLNSCAPGIAVVNNRQRLRRRTAGGHDQPKRDGDARREPRRLARPAPALRAHVGHRRRHDGRRARRRRRAPAIVTKAIAAWA